MKEAHLLVITFTLCFKTHKSSVFNDSDLAGFKARHWPLTPVVERGFVWGRTAQYKTCTPPQATGVFKYIRKVLTLKTFLVLCSEMQAFVGPRKEIPQRTNICVKYFAMFSKHSTSLFVQGHRKVLGKLGVNCTALSNTCKYKTRPSSLAIFLVIHGKDS